MKHNGANIKLMNDSYINNRLPKSNPKIRQSEGPAGDNSHPAASINSITIKLLIMGVPNMITITTPKKFRQNFEICKFRFFVRDFIAANANDAQPPRRNLASDDCAY
ncbi:MAG: hypothetical protein ACI9LE_000739 [Paraglaciecola sp.]|jgi:hypothetical protein